PRRGRRSDRHALAVGLQHHQPDSRPVLHFWLGTVSKTRRYWRGTGHLHRPWHRRPLPVLSPDARHRAHPHPTRADTRELAGPRPTAPLTISPLIPQVNSTPRIRNV